MNLVHWGVGLWTPLGGQSLKTDAGGGGFKGGGSVMSSLLPPPHDDAKRAELTPYDRCIVLYINVEFFVLTTTKVER